MPDLQTDHEKVVGLTRWKSGEKSLFFYGRMLLSGIIYKFSTSNQQPGISDELVNMVRMAVIMDAGCVFQTLKTFGPLRVIRTCS